MELHALFSTIEREKIMYYLLDNASQAISVRGIAKVLGISPGQVHKYVSILRKEGIVEGKMLLDTPVTRVLRVIRNLNRISEAKVVESVRRLAKSAKGVGIFGSWAAGTNDEKADLDLLINCDKDIGDLELARLRRELERALGVAVDVVVATPSRMESFKKKSESFYYSLYNSMTLWGEGL